MASQNSRQQLIAVVLVGFIALLGLNAYFWYKTTTQKTQLDQSQKELVETEKAKSELEKQFYEQLSELDELKGRSKEQDALIEQQKTELRTQKDRLNQLVKSGADSKTIRAELATLKTKFNEAMGRISQLEEENQQLASNNAALSSENNALKTDLSSAQNLNQELSASNSNLSNTKAALENEKANLSKKVSIASVIKVAEVKVVGEKVRSSGKSVLKKRAGSIDRLRVSFKTTPNEIVLPGDEVFYVRIINPLGETIAVEDKGSGVIRNMANGEEVRFTIQKAVDYNNNISDVSVFWDGTGFQEGVYKVEVYNKGYLAGSGSVELR